MPKALATAEQCSKPLLFDDFYGDLTTISGLTINTMGILVDVTDKCLMIIGDYTTQCTVFLNNPTLSCDVVMRWR